MADNRHLESFTHSNQYNISEHDPDVRDWEVVSRDKEKIGTVKDIIIDKDTHRVRYLEVETNRKTPTNQHFHALIPVGAAEIHEKEDRIVLSNHNKSILEKCPAYTGGAITTGLEKDVRKTFRTGTSVDEMEKEPYSHEIYNEKRFYNLRRRSRGRDTKGPFITTTGDFERGH